MTDVQLLPLAALENNKGQIAGVPKNPRIIRNEQYMRLVASLQESDLTDLKPLLVYPTGKGKYVVLGGNMRLRALRELKVPRVSCIVIPTDTDVQVLKKAVIIDNNEFGEYDWDAVANEWSDEPLQDWGVDLPVIEGESEDEEIERKKREFEERMAAGEISEEDEEYQEFLDKFKLKKTTDDCYTPDLVYDAVADWVANAYGVPRSKFVRPFYPGGDYKREEYPQGCAVVDNPPFSILSEIARYYHESGIKFFLFAPHLTLFNIAKDCPKTAIVTGVTITYENGARVNTSFLTNMEKRPLRFMSCPSLYAAVKAANDENQRQQKKQFPKYSYPPYVISAPMLEPFSRLGIEFAAPAEEVQWVAELDAQKDAGKAIYGGGFIISDRLKAEREKAEREKAEREKAEREKAEREKAERWELSPRELAIIAGLSATKETR